MNGMGYLQPFRPVSRSLACGAVLALFACSAAGSAASSAQSRHCADLVARALTTPDRPVAGTFACMSHDEQNFWHRWAVSRDSELPGVVRFGGVTSAGAVDRYDHSVRWTTATYSGDPEANRHLYIVRSDQAPTARGFLVLATDNDGRVDDFVLQMYER